MVPSERILLNRMPKTILMVAAEAREFQGLLSRVPARTLQWGLQFACETELNGNRAILIADGAGMQLAGAAADIALRHRTARCCRQHWILRCNRSGISQLGDVFVASGVIDRENRKRYAVAEEFQPTSSVRTWRSGFHGPCGRYGCGETGTWRNRRSRRGNGGCGGSFPGTNLECAVLLHSERFRHRRREF